MTSTIRTARCGPACRGGVGGERSDFSDRPYPDYRCFLLLVLEMYYVVHDSAG